MDRPLALILAALAISLGLFFADIFPYPFGLIILVALAVARLLQISGNFR